MRVPLTLTLLLLVPVAIAKDVEVDTPSGPLLGYSNVVSGRYVNIFLGVPFAKPPIGELRFRPPEKIAPWSHRVNATSLPSSCWQTLDESFDRFPGVEMWNANTPMNEDCLYLNVWAPVTKKERGRLAVMLWLYGGGFSSGSSTLDIYDGRQLARHGDVLVVSAQYRVGPLGFLSAGQSAPGNVGLLDQYEAIAWIRDNVASLGGDPDRITLFGESAGAVSTSLHLFSPLSSPLIAHAIMQSGSLLCPWALDSPDRAKDNAVKLCSVLDCQHDDPDDMVNCLRNVTPERLTAAQWQMNDESFVNTPFMATVDGYFLPDTPDALLKRGAFKNTSILLGSNSNEGNYFLVYLMPDLFPLDTHRPLTRSEYSSAVRRFLGERASPLVARVVDFEYGVGYEFQHHVDYGQRLDQMVADSDFVCPTNRLAEAYAMAGSRVYSYLFDHVSSQNPWPEWMGVIHGYEIDHVFGHPLNTSRGYTMAEKTLSESMVRYWSNFAKTG